VMHGLELLKRGAIWRIGSGSHVRIWCDNWIQWSDSLKILDMKKHSRLRWISSLINPVTRTWHSEVNGIFRVCSAYRLGLAQKLHNLSIGESSVVLVQSEIWCGRRCTTEDPGVCMEGCNRDIGGHGERA
jgi:hypothetical protein